MKKAQWMQRITALFGLCLTEFFLNSIVFAHNGPVIPAKTSRFKAVNQDPIIQQASQTVIQGREIFRFDTFGDEQFWTDALHLQQAITGQPFGGVGEGLSPQKALDVGLKVDVDALSPDTVQAIKTGKVDLNDVAVTLDLLRQDTVVGVKGTFKNGNLQSVGITCALCHSTVTPGIGHRLDGWANRDLNVADAGLDRAFRQAAIAHDPLQTGLGLFHLKTFQEGADFRFDRRRQQTLGAFPQDIG